MISIVSCPLIRNSNCCRDERASAAHVKYLVLCYALGPYISLVASDLDTGLGCAFDVVVVIDISLSRRVSTNCSLSIYFCSLSILILSIYIFFLYSHSIFLHVHLRLARPSLNTLSLLQGI